MAGLVERGSGNRPRKQAQLAPSKLAHINLGPNCSVVLDQLGRQAGVGAPELVEQGSAGSRRRRPGCVRVEPGAGQWAARVVARGGVRTSVEARERVRGEASSFKKRGDPRIPHSLPMIP